MYNKILSLNWWSRVISLVVLLLVFDFQAEGRAAESGEFSGTWIANGTREVFPFGAERNVYTFNLTGHVNLQTTIGQKKDYWSTCVGLSDSFTGTVARCVWQDLDGPEVYITLQSDQMQEDNIVTGNIIGGSMHLKGIQGGLSFKWSSVTFQKDGKKATVTGQAADLVGSYQIP